MGPELQVLDQGPLRCVGEEGVLLPIVVHNGDEQAHLVHVFWGDVKDDGLVVDGVEGVLFYGRFLLFQSPPITQQGYFDIGICVNERAGQEDR